MLVAHGLRALDRTERPGLRALKESALVERASVRAIGFFDTNLTWFRNLPAQDRPDARLIQHENGFRNYLPDTPSGVVRQSWNNGVGLGIRMYLRGVVLPLIGFDVAYGIEPNTFRYYLAIGSVLD